MKLTINALSLAQWLNNITKIIPANSTLPILKNIFFEAKENKLKLRGSDINSHCLIELPANVEEEGTTTVPAKLITNYIGFVWNEEIKLELVLETQTLLINSISNDTEIKCTSSNDFPSLPKTEDNQEIKLKVENFLPLVNDTSFACAKDMTRPIFAWVYLYNQDKILIGVGTDSFRLAEKKLNKLEINNQIKTIIPARNINTFSSIVSGLDIDNEDELSLKIEKYQIIFCIKNLTFITKTIEWTFPDYQNIISVDAPTTIKVNKENFINKIKQINIFSSVYSNSIILNITEQKLELSAENDERGRSKSILEITKTGENNKVAVNSLFLLEWLARIKTEEVEIEINEENKPIILKDTENNFIYLILPLKI